MDRWKFLTNTTLGVGIIALNPRKLITEKIIDTENVIWEDVNSGGIKSWEISIINKAGQNEAYPWLIKPTGRQFLEGHFISPEIYEIRDRLEIILENQFRRFEAEVIISGIKGDSLPLRYSFRSEKPLKMISKKRRKG